MLSLDMEIVPSKNPGVSYHRILHQQVQKKYFDAIPDEHLMCARVFLDPDNGISKEKPTSRHILFSELNSLVSRMGNASILMVYQYFPRQNHFET
jgi:hypothetical protein